MDVQTFLSTFGVIAEAPGGIDRLREMILDLALAGRLAGRGPEDEPVDVLLTRLAIARRRIRQERGVRKQKHLSPVEPADEPHEIPEHWKWVRLAELAHPQAGFAFKSSHFNEAGQGLPLIRIRDIGNGKTECFFDGEYREEFVVGTGDYLVGMDGNFNIRLWEGGRALLNQRVTRLIFFDGEIAQPFVVWALQTEIDKLHGTRAYTTVQHLSGKQIAAAAIPLPPLGEQRRIVARVDELMQLCDDLESRQHAWTTATSHLRASALHFLTNAETGGDLATAWTRVHDNWDAIVEQADAVDDIRSVVLELAIRGRLAAQDPTDEPAASAVERAAATRRRLLESGSIRRQKAIDVVTSEDVPFTLPEGWIWTRMDDVFYVSGGIQKSPKRRPRQNAFPYLRVANVQRGQLELSDIERFELYEGELEKLRLEEGDLLVVEGNGSEAEIGRVARFGGEISDCVHQNHLIRCRPLEPGIERFVMRYLNSPTGMEVMKDLAVTTSGLYNLSVGKIRAIPVPIPPLAEQRRIADQTDQLLAGCDQLEARLRSSTQLAAELAAATVHHLVS